MCQFLPERLGIAMAGKIHDGFCTKLYSTHDLLHFDIIIFAVSGNAKVYIDLGAEHAADTFRVQAGMVFVGTDRNFSFGDQLPSVSQPACFLSSATILICGVTMPLLAASICVV